MLHGRSREIEAVEAFLDGVLDGRQGTLVVEGEAGIGKTRLASETIDLARRRGFETLYGAAQPAERSRPFGAIASVLGLSAESPDPARAAIARTLESLERPQSPAWVDPLVDVGFRLTDAAIELLQQIASRGPLLIVLDDLHWADRPSTYVIESAHPRLSGLPIALVATLRSGAGPTYVHELLDRVAGNTTHLRLGSLPDDAIAALGGELAGGTPGATLRRQLSRVGGNPFFATELIRTLGDLGLLEVVDGVADSQAATMPRGLVETVRRRLRLQPEATVDLLQIASVLGQSFSVRDLVTVTQQSTLDVLRHLSPAMRSGTLRESEDQLTFGHALTWEAVYHEMPMSARRAIHRHAADALAAAGASPVQVARHFVLGADVGDGEAVTWLRRAARAAAPSSPAVASELLGNALALTAEHDPGWESIVAELAPLLVVTGQLERANVLTNRALSRDVDSRIETRLRVGMTHVMMRSCQVNDALHQVSRLLEQLPAQSHAQVAGVASLIHLISGDVDTAESLATEALDAADQARRDVVRATALMTLTWTHSARGEIDAALAAGHRAVEVTEASRAPFTGFLFPHLPLGLAQLQADRIDEAERTLTEGLDRADRTAAPGTVVYNHAGLAAAKFIRAEWDDAVSEAEVTLDLIERTGTSWPLAPTAVSVRIAVARDDLVAAQRAIDRALETPAADQSMMTTDWLQWARAVLESARGDLDRAVTFAERAWTATPELRDVIGNRIIPLDCLRVARSAGADRLAADICDGMETLAARTSVPSLEAASAHCRGLTERDPEPLRRAVDLLEGVPRRYQLAMAEEDLAGVLSPDDRDEARRSFGHALDIYRDLGARRDVARVAQEMRSAGLRPRGGRTRGGSPGSLTRTEDAVAKLVAEGLSNPQIGERLFISRHTVETHVKHIFSKLGLSSRAELAALVVRTAASQPQAEEPARNT